MNNKKTPWYVLRSPELGKPFQEFYEACETKGVLDNKTKALLMLAVASMSCSQKYSEKYIVSAYNAGASKEEITEALLIAAAENAEKNIAWVDDITIKPFQKTGFENRKENR